LRREETAGRRRRLPLATDISQPPRPGDRAPAFGFRHDEGSATSVAERLRNGRFLVLSVSHVSESASPVELPDAAAALAETWQTETTTDTYRPGFHYVIRPDGYVAMVAELTAPARVPDYLAQWVPDANGSPH
jgi:hypothetical protein